MLVDGFLPRVRLDDKPASRRSGFQEFGLPFAPDAGDHAVPRRVPDGAPDARATDPARPRPVQRRAVRVAGAARAAAGSAGVVVRRRRCSLARYAGRGRGRARREAVASSLDALTPTLSRRTGRGSTAGPRPSSSPPASTSPSRGAAYYGMVRRGKGVRITGGLAHSYYLGVETGRRRTSPRRSACCRPASRRGRRSTCPAARSTC